MFIFLKEWIQNITFYFILVTLVMQMIPNQSYKKYIQFFTGLILVLLLAEPIMNIVEMDFSIEDYTAQIEEFEEAIRYLGKMEGE